MKTIYVATDLDHSDVPSMWYNNLSECREYAKQMASSTEDEWLVYQQKVDDRGTGISYPWNITIFRPEGSERKPINN